MRVVVQRVSSARVRVKGEVVGEIRRGLLLLCAFHATDSEAELDWMSRKICDLRIFNDDEGRMNRSVRELDGELLVVSQFTLYGDARKGRRPSFVDSAPGPRAEELYRSFLGVLGRAGLKVETGTFAAHMEVELCNDGPVTLILDRDAELR
jgi:D-tyrosyl-tRNA(Tyr) deacylase